jgi:hypothetical protein
MRGTECADPDEAVEAIRTALASVFHRVDDTPGVISG